MQQTTVLFLLFLPLLTQGQVQKQPYAERPDQAPMPVAQQRRTTPAYRLNGSTFSIRQVNVDAAGRNIAKDAANEPSLVIDPVNPKRMAIGWRQFDTIASNFRQAGIAFSMDAGDSWQNQLPIERGVFRSDPVLDADEDGNFYYNSLSSSTGSFICHVFKSKAGSSSWGSGVFAHGGDKQWMAIDRTGLTTNGNIYAFWKMGISSCNGGFTRSLNDGASYSPCEALPGDPERGTLVVSPSGELYACGGAGSSFVVLKSSKPGAAEFDWDLMQEVDLGGELAIYDGPNPGGMLGQAWIDVDNSGGPTQGFVYLLATVTNDLDHADIFITRSTDGGQTWEAPVRINDDAGINWQWFGSLSVAPTGRIDVTWYDTRDNPGTFLSRLYYSHSEDGGSSWSPNEALSEAFDPHLGWPNQNKIGDYNHQRSDESGAHLAWSATFNGEQDVYYSYIKPGLPSATAAVSQQSRVIAAPNPSSGSIRFHTSLPQPGHLQVAISDAQGRPAALLDAGYAGAGKQTVEWQAGDAAGLYFYRVLCDGVLVGAGKVVKL